MPWDIKSAPSHTKKANTPKKARQWSDIANSALQRTGSEVTAIKEANGVLKKERSPMKLTAAARRKIPKAKFGIPSKAPGSGSYPMNDKEHASLAKSYSTKAVRSGRMSTSQKSMIDRKANRVLGESGGSAMDAAESALMRKRRMRK
jgi:hypothetical protein